MSISFTPKYISKYNQKNAKSLKCGSKQESSFCAHKVQFSKAIQLQNSYESRIEKNQLRKYNG